MARSKHPGALRAILRQHLTVLIRDRRFMILGLLLLLASASAFVTGTVRNQRIADARAAAAGSDTAAWASQGVVNPHGAAHFGHYVFKPVSALAALDPGLSDHLGTMVRLEAHKQTVARDRPSDAGVALTHFAHLTASSALQVLAPLLIVLIGFSAFSGDRARGLLNQELAAGIDPRWLLTGRLAAASLAIVAMLTLFAVAAATALFAAAASAGDLTRLGLMLIGYALYLFTFLAVAMGVSALSPSSRTALTALLAFWICAALLVPRVAPAIAAQVHPTPSLSKFESEIQAAIDTAMDAGGTRGQRAERLKTKVLEQYGVQRIEDLPVHISGVLLQYSEDLSTHAYEAHFAQLYRTYERQIRLQRAFALMSPLITLKAWSAALAGTDLATHYRFLRDAERYRYAFVQRLNEDISHNRPHTNDEYAADVARITADVDRFQPSTASLAETWRRQWPDLLGLLAWAAAAGAFAMLCVARLRHAP